MEKPILRSRSIGTKVSDEEYAQLEKLAEARGITPVLGLRMLYLNTVQALGRGGQTTEELQKLIERVDREKQRKARERLSGQSGDRASAEGRG